MYVLDVITCPQVLNINFPISIVIYLCVSTQFAVVRTNVAVDEGLFQLDVTIRTGGILITLTVPVELDLNDD